MIPVNELRHGNKISYYRYDLKKLMFDTVDEVIYSQRHKLNFIKVSKLADNINPELLFPIILSPEILDKCGFRKTAFWNGIVYDFKIGSLSFMYQAGKGLFVYAEDRDITTEDAVGGIYYLHQLQNFYYSLSGEELRVNL